MNAETAPTGTEATTARIAEVLAEHMGCGPGEILTETVGADVDSGPGEIAVGQLCKSNAHNYAYWSRTCQFADDLAALLSAGVIRDMQAAALREAATALDMEPIPNHLWGQPNKKAWFCEGARWVLDQVRDRAARIEEQR